MPAPIVLARSPDGNALRPPVRFLTTIVVRPCPRYEDGPILPDVAAVRGRTVGRVALARAGRAAANQPDDRGNDVRPTPGGVPCRAWNRLLSSSTTTGTRTTPRSASCSAPCPAP